MKFTIGLGPSHLSRIMFGFEMAVALGTAEPEHLIIVPDESHAMARVDGPRAEITLLYSHVEVIL